MRRLLFALVVGVVLAPAAAWAQAPAGTINLHLMVPAGTGLTGTSVRLEDASTTYARTVELSSGPGPFSITGSPVANSYAAIVTSQRFGGGVCLGSNMTVPVVANGTTILFVNLTCTATPPKPVPGLGRYAPLLGQLILGAGNIGIRRGRRRSA